jgi:hypothetical protein
MGANIQKQELHTLAALSGIKSIYLHLITNFTGTTVDEYLEDLCRRFPEVSIYASGEGVSRVERNFSNLRLLRSDKAIYDFIEEFRP